MKKSYILQSLAVFLLVVNILGLDFDNLLDYNENKTQIINIAVAILLLFFQLLDDGSKRKKEEASRSKPAGKAFGKRKEL